MDNKIILASASPRRRELIKKFGLEVEICPADIEEKVDNNLSPIENVMKFALDKASVISDKQPYATVIGSDTIVVFKNIIMGKPIDKASAIEMLALLSGKTHSVFTGLAILNKEKKIFLNSYDETLVTMKKISYEEILEYIKCGEYIDKAGAYAIQGEAEKFIKDIKGSYSNVVGLPLKKLEEMLYQAGIKIQIAETNPDNI